MTHHDAQPPAPSADRRRRRLLRRVAHDRAGATCIHIKRMPEMLLDVTIQPVMFVLLFAYVFGGSIAVRRRRLQGVPAARDHGADDGLLLRSSSRWG